MKPSRILGRVALSALVAILIASALGAEPAPSLPTVDDELDVRLVELEVQVVDRRGAPIDGLGIDDFELWVDGDVVPIELFAAGRSTVEPEATTGGQDTDDRLWLALYVDRRFLRPGDFDEVREHLEAFLTDGLPSNSRVMLVVAGGELDVRVPFKIDPQPAIEALRGLDGEDSGHLLQEYRSVLRDLQRRSNFGGLDMSLRINTTPVTNEPGLGGAAPPPPASPRPQTQRLDQEPRALLQQIDAFHRQATAELHQVAAELDRTLQMMAGLPGRRHILYLGNHLPTAASRTLFDAWRDAFSNPESRTQGNEPGTEALDPDRRFASARFDALTAGSRFLDTGSLFAGLALDASAAGVVLHAVEAAPHRSRRFASGSGDADQATFGLSDPGTHSFETAVSLATDDGLLALTEGTGGRLLRRSKRFDDYFDALERDLVHPYVLGFTPTLSSEPQSVEVRLVDRDDRSLRRAEVRHPHAVRATGRDEELARRTVAALTLGDLADNPLDASVEAGAPRADADGTTIVPLTVRLPLSRLALVPDRQAHSGRLSVFTTAGDFGGEIAPVTKSVVPVRVRNSDLLTALGRDVDLNVEVRLPASGARQLAVTVRDDFRPAGSTLVTDLHLDPPAGAADSE